MGQGIHLDLDSLLGADPLGVSLGSRAGTGAHDVEEGEDGGCKEGYPTSFVRPGVAL